MSDKRTPNTRTAFISGPVDPSEGYFDSHYKQRILDAIAAEHSFVVGPAPGIDTISLRFLCENVPAARVTVFVTTHENQTHRPGLSWFEEAGGNVTVAGITTGDRDAAATASSDYDILRYLTVEEAKARYGGAWYPKVTATEMNERRRDRVNQGASGKADKLIPWRFLGLLRSLFDRAKR